MIPFAIPEPVLLALIPLAVAAGLDLYLTLLLLGIAALAGWGTPLPGNLGDLGAAPLLAMAAGFYLVELGAERSGRVSLFWNSAHAPIRALGAFLLLVMALPGAPLSTHLVGGLAAALLAGVAHGGRFGTRQLLRLAAPRPPSFALVSLAEDVLVLALVAMALDAPASGAVTGLALVVLVLTVGRPAIRASLFAMRLAWGVWSGLLSQRRWRAPADFPGWLQRAGAGDGLAPGGLLRGAPAGGWRVPGGGPFRIGWVVITGTGPFFLHRGLVRVHSTSLAGARVRGVVERAVFQRVELLDAADHPFALLLPRDGPAADVLRGEFRRDWSEEPVPEEVPGQAD